MDFKVLLPEPRTASADELLDALSLNQRAPAERPYVVVNFIASADGRAAFQGRSGALGGQGDSELFHGLRERVDAVLAGTATMRAERYGRILGKPERRARRVQQGRSPEPLAVLISRSGDLDLTIPLFAEPEARVAIFSATPVDTSNAAAELQSVELDPEELTPTAVLHRLRTEFGIESLLCEGGPTLFGAMLQEGVVDELFLTLSPKLTGGGAGATITSGPELAEPLQLRLAWLLEREQTLFLRYELSG